MTKDTSEITNLAWVKKMLAEPLLARLATCNPKTLQPHVVPVWYEWDGNNLWISTFRSTRKVREIQINPKISVVIDTDARGEAARAVILEGKAELISDPENVVSRAASIYTRYLGPEGVKEHDPQSWIYDPENLLIKLTPAKVYLWGEN